MKGEWGGRGSKGGRERMEGKGKKEEGEQKELFTAFTNRRE